VGLFGLLAALNQNVVPLALLAVVGAVCQFIPHLGPVLGLIGPGLTAAAKVTSHWEHAEQLLYVLILYAAIAIVTA